MEAKGLQGLQLGTFINPQKIARKPSSLQLLQKYGEQRSYQAPISCHLSTRNGRYQRPVLLKVSCCSQNIPVLEQGSTPSVYESKILKEKSEEIEPYLNGRCIYLVGMMGSGKTTVGKVLSEALGYSVYDCDALIELAVGGTSVAEIFKLYGESFFRDNETDVLQKLSLMHRLVVSTGGGAVVRPVNWKHMQKGIVVWLDVPLEALARRITAVGTGSRPLLHHESGDPYSKTMKRLSTLFKERGEAYANCNARVSLQNIAKRLGYQDVCNITPSEIAIELRVKMRPTLLRLLEHQAKIAALAMAAKPAPTPSSIPCKSIFLKTELPVTISMLTVAANTICKHNKKYK